MCERALAGRLPPPSLLAVWPSVSLPLFWPGSLKCHPNINICQTDGREEVNLSLASSFSKGFPCVSLVSLAATVFLPPPRFFFFCLPLSHLFSLPVVTFDPNQLTCVSGTCLSKMAFFFFVQPWALSQANGVLNSLWL